MKLDILKENLTKIFNKQMLSTLLSSVEEAANTWSTSIFTAIKLIAALFGLIALIATIIVGTQWFIAAYGSGTFIFTLIVSSFVLSVLTTFSAKQIKTVEPVAKTTRTRTKAK